MVCCKRVGLDQIQEHPHVVLVEDEPLVRVTLTGMLEEGGYRVTPVISAEEALEVVAAMPDVQAGVTDVSLATGSMDGVALARRLIEEHDLGVVVVSGQGAPQQGELPSGTFFLAKPVYQETLLHIVEEALRRRSTATPPAEHEGNAPEAAAVEGLSQRRREVLNLLVQGKSNEDIAEALGMALNTVKVHLAFIYKTFGVSTRAEAIDKALKGLQQRE
jgi:DNA-binding NarL/FixJ family response regulator